MQPSMDILRARTSRLIQMFDRYLLPYQIILYALPLCLSIPLSSLLITPHTKSTVQYLTVTLVSYNCTHVNIYVFCLMVYMRYNNNTHNDCNTHNNKRLVTLSRTLGVGAAVGAAVFYAVYHRLLQMYTTSWMVNIGYVFWFGMVVQVIAVVWLVEIVNV